VPIPVPGATLEGSEDHPRASLEPPTLLLPVPGTEPRRRFRFRIDWDLIACGLHGHDLRGTDAAELTEEHAPFAREADGIRWHRCLRCEAWTPLEPPTAPTVSFPPAPQELELPIRGRRLRDRYVLRLIVLDRAVHVVVLTAIIVAAFLFAQHRLSLHHTYIRVLNALQGSSGGPAGSSHSGVFGDIDKLFKLSPHTIYLAAAALTVYTVVLVIESVGLWFARRWAEYLTLLETGILVPWEVYQLVVSVTPIKAATLVINTAIVLYLLLAHRLFGLRGGVKAAEAIYGDGG
jgi:uncharacterized membrane protein (DUF2068 family)